MQTSGHVLGPVRNAAPLVRTTGGSAATTAAADVQCETDVPAATVHAREGLVEFAAPARALAVDIGTAAATREAGRPCPLDPFTDATGRRT